MNIGYLVATMAAFTPNESKVTQPSRPLPPQRPVHHVVEDVLHTERYRLGTIGTIYDPRERKHYR